MFTVTRQGTVSVITGKETVSEANLDELNHRLEECLRDAPPRVVLNLTDVALFDSRGLEWLLDSAERCSQRGGQLQLAAPNALCRDILTVTGVGESFERFDDLRAAVRSFNR